MWFRKKASEYVECAGCGCLMRLAWKKVEVVDFGSSVGEGFMYMTYWEPHPHTESYCGRCAPPYDIKRVGSEVRYSRKEPARNVEVDEKGKDIKEKPAPH